MKKLLIITLALVFAVSVFAVEDETPEPKPNNYKVTANTNRGVYNHREVMQLTVRILNNGGLPVALNPIVPDQQDPAEGVEEGTLEDEEVQVSVDGYVQKFVGHVRVIPLGKKAVTEDGEEVQPKRFRLPLFGNPIVQGHSSEIISRAKVLVLLPKPPADDEEEPVAAATDENEEKPKPELINALAKCPVPGPGEYLLDVDITTIEGVKVAKAQKVIRVAPRKISPQVKMLKDIHRDVAKVDAKVKKDIEIDQATKMTTRINQMYLKIILKYFLRVRVPAAPADIAD